MTRDELGAAVTARRKFRHLRSAFAEKSATLLKPLAWQGETSFGPPREDMQPSSDLTATLAGQACPTSTTPGRVRSRRTSGRTGLLRLPTCTTGSARASARAASGSSPGSRPLATALLRSTSTGSPRLSCATISRSSPPRLRRPPSDYCRDTTSGSWVRGRPTSTLCRLPGGALISGGPNVVIVGGVVSGTWSLTDDQVVAAWFAEAEQPEKDALAEEVSRLAANLDRPLRSSIQMA